MIFALILLMALEKSVTSVWRGVYRNVTATQSSRTLKVSEEENL
jgi:hypothetical protein